MLRQLLRSGQPFSGGERHCCFLNTKTGSFADVSALSGLDIPDDGRAIGVVDWDHDGRQDLWIVNRSGPQIRLMRNVTSQSKHSYVAIKLRGVESNRDAIGARVALTSDEWTSKQIRTVRAGDGYLSQSTRWLHFGLKSNKEPVHVAITWPSGKVQEIDGLAANGRYVITEGVDKVATIEPRSKIKLASSRPATEPTRRRTARIALATPLPIPPLAYETASGESVELGQAISQRPRLVSLWSSSCRNCLAELDNFESHQGQLEAAGIDVVTLNVDRIAPASNRDLSVDGTSPTLPFTTAGVATERTVDQLQLIHDIILDLHQTLPVPSSFLIDGQGRLADIYTGPIEVDQLLMDVDRLVASPSERRRLAVPFDGRWSSNVKSPRVLRLALEMLLRGWVEETELFQQQHQEELSLDSDYYMLLYNLGQQYSRRQDHQKALALYQETVRHRPKFAAAHFNMGVTLAQAGQLPAAAKYFSQAVAADARDADARLNLGRTLLRLGRIGEAHTSLQEAQAIAPDDAEICYELALVYALNGAVDNARQQYARAVELVPKYVAASYRHKLSQAALVAARSLDAQGTAGRKRADQVRRWIGELDATE